VYAAGTTLFAVGFDLNRLAVTTEPASVVEGVVVKSSGAADFDIAGNGTLVYVPGAEKEGNLWTFDIALAARNSLTTGDADDRGPVWHPFEDRIVFASNRDGRWGLFAINSDGTGEVKRLMTDGQKAVEMWPHSFSLDGRTVVFASSVNGDGNIGMVPLDGGA
jgi:Tol biopolymer transport system component